MTQPIENKQRDSLIVDGISTNGITLNSFGVTEQEKQIAQEDFMCYRIHHMLSCVSMTINNKTTTVKIEEMCKCEQKK